MHDILCYSYDICRIGKMIYCIFVLTWKVNDLDHVWKRDKYMNRKYTFNPIPLLHFSENEVGLVLKSWTLIIACGWSKYGLHKALYAIHAHQTVFVRPSLVTLKFNHIYSAAESVWMPHPYLVNFGKLRIIYATKHHGHTQRENSLSHHPMIWKQGQANIPWISRIKIEWIVWQIYVLSRRKKNNHTIIMYGQYNHFKWSATITYMYMDICKLLIRSSFWV